MSFATLGGRGARALAATAAAALVVTALAGTASAAGPGKAPIMCHGKQPTQHITQASQLIPYHGEYAVNGTRGNDVILVYMQLPHNQDNLYVNLTHWNSDLGNIGGGTDDVCVFIKGDANSGNDVQVRGGANVTVKDAWYTYVDAENGATVDITGPRAVVFSSGDVPSTTTITSDSSLNGVVFAQVTGSDADDTITVNVPAGFDESYVAIDGGLGRDTITVDAPSGAQALVIGGQGHDFITTGSSTDLVYDPSVTYKGKVVAPNLPVTNFTNAATALLNDAFSSLNGTISPNWTGDPSGNAISTGGGNDIAYGDDGYDDIRLGSGNDWADAGRARDHMWGGDGNDTMLGGPGNDDIYGEDGNDTLDGETDGDLINGGKGNDVIDGGSGNDELHGNENNDRIQGGSGIDIIYGEDGDDWLRGNDGADSINGGSGSDDCNGGAGDDTLKGCNP